MIGQAKFCFLSSLFSYPHFPHYLHISIICVLYMHNRTSPPHPQTRKGPLGGREVWRLWAESSAEPSPRTLLEAPAALDTEEEKKLGSRGRGKRGHKPGRRPCTRTSASASSFLAGWFSWRSGEGSCRWSSCPPRHPIWPSSPCLSFQRQVGVRGSQIAHHLRIKSCESPSDRSSPVVSYNTAPLHAKALKW